MDDSARVQVDQTLEGMVKDALDEREGKCLHRWFLVLPVLVLVVISRGFREVSLE